MKIRNIVLYISLLIIIGLMVGSWLTYRFLNHGFEQKVNATKVYKPVTAVNIKEGPKVIVPFNLLVLGIDNDEKRNWHGRTDTMVLLRFVPNEKKIKALSIPRDTLSTIPGYGQDKINHAYAFGGTELAIQTVEKFSGQKIDYYLQMDMDGFTSLVDKIGGVDFVLDRNIPWANKILKVGQHHLNGEQALAVVRFRHEPQGDIARVKRQMRFVKAVIEQSLDSKESVNKILMLRRIEENIQTDLGLKDILALLNTFKDSGKQNLVAEIVPGTFYNYKRISYWKPDKKKLADTIEKLFG